MRNDLDGVVENAIAWATQRLGSTAYGTRCLAFVEDAIERSNDLEVFGGDDAHASAVLYHCSDRQDEPPRGVLAFYDCDGTLAGRRRNWGHVGLSLGDGLVIHAWDRVRIDRYDAITHLSPAPGWSAPGWAGWVPMLRVLEGSVQRSWTDDDAAVTAARMQQARHATLDG
ncbi:hypothetical protein J4G33_05150 [Actinotalea sp. BY-33]|uniref:NlpC/P60 domain-containing protein n=1 Tax=Actinotalea soli TaxID=2819234 RepID=A0A939LRA7_9CELL|nr:hypothetical protein [Actinotalea soli]MBO1751185.1 hypothetical protein [Actinotalea soli]